MPEIIQPLIYSRFLQGPNEANQLTVRCSHAALRTILLRREEGI